MSATQDLAREKISELVEKYRSLTKEERKEITEAQVVHQFLDLFLKALGWPIEDPNLYKYEPSTQAGRPDMVLTPPRGRTTGKNCDCRGTFIDVYEAQIQWYLDNFIIPEDYRERILDAHRKLESAYDDTEKHRTLLGNRLKRLQEQYEWGHIQKDEYLDKHNPISRELAVLTPSDTKNETLNRLARFLKDIGAAWVEATQEQRNRLANALFQDIIMEHNRVVQVRPRAELRPFFRLSYEEHPKVSRANRTDFRHTHP